MTEGAPWKNLLIIIVPMIIGNVFQQMYSTVDAIIVSRFVGDNALAAIGSTMSLFFFILAFFIGITSGASIMVSQYFGAKRREELSHTIGTSITILTVISIIIMILGPMVTLPLLRLLNTPEAIIGWAASYINILLRGILGVAYYNMLSGILRGLGDSFSPLVYLIIANIISMLLSLLFVPVLGLGVAGAAIATVIAQFISGILCLRRLMQMCNVFDMSLKYLRPSRKYVMQIIKLGVPVGVSQAVFALSMVLMQPLINGFGPVLIAASVIVIRIDGFVMMPIFSFGNAAMVYTGQNIGAGKLNRVSQGTRQCILMAIGTSTVIVIGILLFGSTAAGLFTDTGEILDLSMYLLRVLAFGYIVMALSQVLWGVILGAGDTITPMWTSIITVVIRVPVAYLLIYLTGSPASTYYAMLIAWIIGGMFAIVFYRAGKWRTKGLINQG